MIKYYLKILAFRLSPLFVVLGIHHLFSFFRSDLGHILMFHRIVPNDEKRRIHNHLSLEVTPENLEKVIVFFRKLKYDIISLDEVEEYRKSNKKFVVFTLDDGYKDNLQFAYPIFKKHNCPFTIYVQNSFPNGNAFVWWYLLEDLLLNEDFISIQCDTFELIKSVDTDKKKEAAFVAIREAINNGLLPLDILSQLLADKGLDWEERSKQYFLTWNDIKTLSNDTLVTIGAHTLSHRALKRLSAEEAYEEIKGSKDELELLLGLKVKHFAYPFGSRKEVSKKDVQLVREIGFETAVTTVLGNINNKQESSQLPRITVNAMTTLSVLKMQLSGLYGLLDNGLKGDEI